MKSMVICIGVIIVIVIFMNFIAIVNTYECLDYSKHDSSVGSLSAKFFQMPFSHNLVCIETEYGNRTKLEKEIIIERN